MRITNPVAVFGENAACKYLQGKGYKILERNFRKGYGEIDIIAKKDTLLVFVEVKTRTSNKFGTPFEAISHRKLEKLLTGAKYYKYILHPELPDNLRIDAIGVMLSGGKIVSLEHLKNISSF